MHTLPARVKAFWPSPPSLPTPTRLPCRPAGLGRQLHAKLGRWAAEARTGMRAVPLGQATLGRSQGGELGPREGTVWPVTYTPQTHPGTWASAPGQVWGCAWMGLAEKPEMRRTPTQAGHPETPPPTHPAQTTTPWHLVGWGERATGTESLHHCKCKSVLFTFIPQGNAWHIVGAQSICATWTEKGRKDLYRRVTMGLKVVFFSFCLFLNFFCKNHIAFFNVGKRKSYFKTVSLRSLWPQGN